MNYRAIPAGSAVEKLRVDSVTPPANNSIRSRTVMCFHFLSVRLGVRMHIDLFLARLGFCHTITSLLKTEARLGGFLSISSCNFFLSLSARVLAAAIWAKIKPASYLFKRIKFFVIFGTIGTVGNAVRVLQSSVSVPFAVVFKSQFIKFLLAFNFYFFGVFVGKIILNQISNNGDRQCYC